MSGFVLLLCRMVSGRERFFKEQFSRKLPTGLRSHQMLDST